MPFRYTASPTASPLVLFLVATAPVGEGRRVLLFDANAGIPISQQRIWLRKPNPRSPWRCLRRRHTTFMREIRTLRARQIIKRALRPYHDGIRQHASFTVFR